ncbi:MAG: orotate phosphoribosyltransferase [Gammaproteobacteria bacterium]
MTREQMRAFVAAHCLITGGDIALSGGGAASFYFDCKRAVLRGDFLISLADWILDEPFLRAPTRANVVGGPTMGADFIAAAAAIRAAQRGENLTRAAIVRKEPKKHGTKNKIENEPDEPSRILIVEDVITTGGSIARACDEFLAAGHSIAAVAAVIDRRAGGKEMLEQKYRAPVFSLFTKDDFGDLS